MFRILVVEDDAALSQLFCRVLTKNGYLTFAAADGEEALALLEREYVDLMISDVMMPRMDGYALVHALREAGSTIPVLMITAKDGALLRRAQMINERRQTVGSTVLEYDSMTVYRDGRGTVLPQKEFQLLYKLLSFPGRIFTRQQLMDDIWGVESETEARTVDVHINRLRDRFRDNPDFELVTVRGLGYKAVKRHAG